MHNVADRKDEFRVNVFGMLLTPWQFGFIILVILIVGVQMQFTVFLFIFGVRWWNILPVIVTPVISLIIWLWIRMRVTVIPTVTEDPAAVNIDRLTIIDR